MSMAEYQLWLAEYQRRPWGEEIEDLRMGTIAATVANAHSCERTFTPAEFIPKFGQTAVDQTDEEIEADCRAFFALLNARKRHGHEDC